MSEAVAAAGGSSVQAADAAVGVSGSGAPNADGAHCDYSC